MKYTTGKFFLDTNFLIYLFSNQEERKRNICKTILTQGKEGAVFVLSTQVLQEFTSVMIAKFSVDPRIVKDVVREISRLEIIQVDTSLIQEAIDQHIVNRYSFWDSLILSAAIKANCQVLLSEDFQHDQRIAGARIHNPFM